MSKCDADDAVTSPVDFVPYPAPDALLPVFVLPIDDSQESSGLQLENEAAFRTLAEAIPQLVWITAADGGNTYFNQQWCDYTGLTQAESRAAGWNLPFHPDDRQRAWKAWQQATQQLARYELECRLRRANGTYRWWLIRSKPLLNAQGEVQQWFGTCTDIDDIKRTEALLRANEEKLRLATEAAGLGVWSWDPVADVADWETPMIAKIFGLAQNELALSKAQTIAELLHPGDLSAFEKAVARTVQDGKAFSFLGRIRRQDGAQRWIEITGRLATQLNGQPPQLVGTIQDLTERRDAEAALRRRHADAQLVAGIASRLVLRDPRGLPVDPDALLRSTFERLARHLGVELYFNYVVESGQPNTLRLVSSAGLDPVASEAFSRIRFGTHLCGLVAQTRRPLVLGAAAMSQLPNAAALNAAGVKVYAGFPLLSSGHLVGTIAFASKREQAFDSGELELIQVTADLLAAALERERLGDRLRVSEARFREVFQHAGTGIAMADLNGVVQNANPAYCTMLGYTLDELQQIGFSSVIHPDDSARCAEVVQSLVEQALPTTEIELRFLRKDGSEVWVHKVLSMLRDESGAAYSVLELITDITARKRAEVAVSASEERFRAVADGIPQLAWMADNRGKVSWFNQGWLDYTGTTLEDNPHGGWKSAHHPDHVETVASRFALAVQRGEDWEDTFPLRAKDGQFRWFLSRMSAVRDAAGQVVRYLGTHTDITERFELEARLTEHSQRLADEAARKDEFLATLSHELRNPLAPVRNAVHVLKINGHGVPKVQWATGVIERQMQHMTQLIDDLMDMSRINRGRIDLRLQTLDLGAVLQSAVDTVRLLADECGHTLTLALPPQACFVEADLTRLTQVFLNLLNNAVKYTERGRIEVQLRVDGGQAWVTVRDNGIGLAADKLHSIFEMFSQVESALNRSRGGLGIGLALVKRLVELHGGQVEARSPGPGGGSEFVVRLPMVAGLVASGLVARDNAAVLGDGVRILVVDDNRDTADTLAMLLDLMGNSVRTAYDGEAAIAAAADFRPQVVLCDIGLPRMNGYEVCRRLRQEPWAPAITIIATTGWGQPEDRRKSTEAGFDHHLVKPVDPQALLTLLCTLSRPG